MAESQRPQQYNVPRDGFRSGNTCSHCHRRKWRCPVSVRATNFVRRLRGLTITEKAVAMILADHDSHKGDGSFPGMTTLADESCLKNRQTATEVVKRLVAKGVISTDSLSRGGRGKTTVYRF